MTEQSPDALMSPTPLGDGRFHLEIPDGWQQGRGAFGGLITGALVRAARAVSPAPLRAFEAALLGPALPGAAEITVSTLRQGSAVTGMSLCLSQEGGVVDQAIAVTGAARPNTPAWDEAGPATLPDWRNIEPLPAEIPMAPRFSRFFEYRLVGPPPYISGEVAEASGWIRARQTPERLDDAWIAMLIDAWWTGALTRFDAPRPIATLTYTLHLLASPDGLDPAAPLFLSVRAPFCSQGYMSEERRLFGEDGRLLAINHQVIAIIR